MDLKQLVNRLHEYADLSAATDWDNVGLVVEPSEPLLVKRALVTNDLTEPVLEEAISKNVNLIISYHPAITTLKRLTQSEWKQRSIVKCIENRIAVYTPHTTWDSIEGGINDWILEFFDTVKIESIKENKSPNTITGHLTKTVKFILVDDSQKQSFLTNASGLEDVRFVSEIEINSIDLKKQIELEFLTSARGVNNLIDLINSSLDSNVLNSLRIYDIDKPLMKNVGLGRIGYLKEPIKIRDVIEKAKSLLKMKTFRFALANGKTLGDTVSSLAIGAGTSTNLVNNTKAEFIITGELSHHEILHEVHRGVSVIVTDHSNTERCYLAVFKERFAKLLSKYNENLEIILSEVDRDPLEYI